MAIPRNLSNLAPGADTSGVLGVAKGGTGLTSPGTNGNVLVSNGSAWVSQALSSSPFIKYTTKTTTYTAAAGDAAYTIGATGTWTLSLTAAATLGNGWFIYLANNGTGVITVDPNGAETIGGVATAACNPGDVWLIICDGTNFQLERLEGNNYQQFVSSGTFTVPAGVTRIYVQVWGAGGGGGRSDNSSVPSAGGGAGGYSAGWLNVTPGGTITATIGSGGSGKSTNSTAGNNGGTSSFSTISATGGTGGAGTAFSNSYTAIVGQGGVGSGGNITNAYGGFGSVGVVNFSAGAFYAFGGTAPYSGPGGYIAMYFGQGYANDTLPYYGGGGYGVPSGFALSSQTGGDGRILVQWV